MSDFVIYRVEVLEGGYEELYCKKTMVCSMVMPPILNEKENSRCLTISMNNGERYNCDCDIDATIYPGLKRFIVDDSGDKVATLEYDSLLSKKLITLKNTYSLNYCDCWECLILNNKNTVAKIRYPEKPSNFIMLSCCEILISKEYIPTGKMDIFAAILAATRKF